MTTHSGANHSGPQSSSAQATSNPATSTPVTSAAAGNTTAETSFAETSFAELGLARPIVHFLRREGITTAFPIQALTIPDVLSGRDVLGKGPTGSGKTFSFGLPILHRLATSGVSRPCHPRAVILAPTRELAIQISERLEDPAASLGLRVFSVVGGVNINPQIRRLAAPVDLLVATPGRLQDLLNQKKVHLDQVAIATLDEADQMADMGFLPQVTKLWNKLPSDCQHLLFSATLDNQVQAVVDKFLHDPRTHETAPAQSAVETMEHVIAHVGSRENRNEFVEKIAARQGKTIMFMRTKHGVDRQVKKLRRIGVNALGLHGDKSQGARTQAIDGFSDGSIPVLVATDIAARGIDISDVSLVVHIDPPAEHKAYLHRAGRTARAGARGTVVTLVLADQEKTVKALVKKSGVDARTIIAMGPDMPQELRELTGAREPSGTALPPKPTAGGRSSGSRGGNGSRKGAQGSGSREGGGARKPRRQNNPRQRSQKNSAGAASAQKSRGKKNSAWGSKPNVRKRSR